MLLSDLDELEDMLDDIIVDSEKENSEHHDSEDDCEYESKSEEDEEPPFNTDDFIKINPECKNLINGMIHGKHYEKISDFRTISFDILVLRSCSYISFLTCDSIIIFSNFFSFKSLSFSSLSFSCIS